MANTWPTLRARAPTVGELMRCPDGRETPRKVMRNEKALMRSIFIAVTKVPPHDI